MVVVKIVQPPKYYRFDNVEWWEVGVDLAHCETIVTRTLRFKTREEAEEIKVGSEIDI